MTGSDGFFHVNLCTYSDLTRSGAAVIPFVEMAVGLAERAGIGLRLSVERAGTRRSRTGRPLTGKTWDAARSQIESGDFINLFVFNEGNPFSFGVTIQAGDVYDAIAARTHDARSLERLDQARRERPSPRFLNFAIAGLPTDYRVAIQSAGQTFEAVDGACGFVTIDPVQFVSGDQTRYEMRRLRHWSAAPEAFQTHLRGVFWGNFLSARHIDLLGGFERMAREAPCERVERLGTGAYLQANDVPSAASDALERYLAPLL